MKLSSVLESAKNNGYREQFYVSPGGILFSIEHPRTGYFTDGYECVETIECDEDDVLVLLIRTINSTRGVLVKTIKQAI